jgi:hypothetical protein
VSVTIAIIVLLQLLRQDLETMRRQQQVFHRMRRFLLRDQVLHV